MYSTKMGSNVKIIGISVAAFVLLTITLYGGLSFAVWNLKSENSNLQNQITKLQDIVEAKNSNPHSSDEATVTTNSTIRLLSKCY